jgi:hypothetical protein
LASDAAEAVYADANCHISGLLLTVVLGERGAAGL